MKLTRNEIMEAFREEYKDPSLDFDLYHQFSECDKQELMEMLCPANDDFQTILGLVFEAWNNFPYEAFEDLKSNIEETVNKLRTKD